MRGANDLILEARRLGEFMARRAAEYAGAPKLFTLGGQQREAAMPWLTDAEMAGTVRMLTRNDLGHEPIVCAARDRILHLSQELERVATIKAAADDLVALWKAQRVSGSSRAERNAAIEETRERLIRAVDAIGATA